MASERQPFRPDIEGLRGIAILLVVGFHAGVRWLSGGFVGVDVFFVLSGFFITGLLVAEAEETGGIDVARFYARRAMRLLPVLLVVLLVTLASAMWLMAPIDHAPIASAARAAALSASNVEFARTAVDYFHAGENPLLHTWTLAVEQQFYLVWPVLLLLAIAGSGGVDQQDVRSRMLRWIGIAGAISFGLSLVLTRVAQPWAFFGLATRTWEFALGGALAMMLDRDTIPATRPATIQVLGLAAVAAALFLYDSTTPYPGAAALLPALGAGALLIGGHGMTDTRVSRTLALPALRWFGRHSYAWYLWHWPAVVIIAAIDPALGVWGRLAWSGVALGLAVMTHRLIETPAREGRGIFGRIAEARVIPIAIAASIAVALVAHGASQFSRAVTSSWPQRMFTLARSDRMDHDCWASTAEDWKASCVFGDRTSPRVLVLFGDSHAEHWLGALDGAGRAHGWKILAMVKGGCPVADIPRLASRRLKAVYHECARFRDAMLRRIVAMRPDGVILSSWDHYVPVQGSPSPWQVSNTEWRQGLRRTYERLSDAGIRTMAIRGTPRTWFDVPACLSRRFAGQPFASDCTYSRREAIATAAVSAQDQAAQGLGVTFVNMNDAICPTERCQTMVNGIVVFTDDNHLTARFSRSLAPVLGKRVAAALALDP